MWYFDITIQTILINTLTEKLIVREYHVNYSRVLNNIEPLKCSPSDIVQDMLKWPNLYVS